MDAVQLYLQLPHDYHHELEGLRWSVNGDAIEYDTGETFILREPLTQFMLGYGSQRRLIHIGLMLHLLSFFIRHDSERLPEFQWLYAGLRQPGATYRNAGVFAAQLSEMIPPTTLPVTVEEVCSLLSNPLLSPRVNVLSTDDLSLNIESLSPYKRLGFSNLIIKQLRQYSHSDILHWLRHGQPPLRTNALLPELPAPAWEARLDQVLESVRVRGAIPFLTPLLSALTLPPQRMQKDDLPLGGYADVTNRGRIEAVLPAQYALETDDFLRRFAEQELLYFRREDPLLTPQKELVILLDQGIRTWGDVRPRLTAAALVLIGKAVQQRRPVHVGISSNPVKWIDPIKAPLEELMQTLEVSDLTEKPADLIEAASQKDDLDRFDFILLTHPRSLEDQEVIEVNRQLTLQTRLFVLAVDESSQAIWSQIKDGRPTKLQRFAVHPVERPVLHRRRAEVAQALPLRSITWSGTVEPYASPFQVPIRGEIVDFDVDIHERWIFILDNLGCIRAWELERPFRMQVLPRTALQNKELVTFQYLVGVADGVVAVRYRRDNSAVMVHYQMENPVAHAVEFSDSYRSRPIYDPRLSEVIAYDKQAEKGGFIFNLQQEQVFHESSVYLDSRLDTMPWRARSHFAPLELSKGSGGVSFDSRTGSFSLRNLDLTATEVVPLDNGKPRHQGEILVEARMGKDTLCVKLKRNDVTRLYAYHLPAFTLTGEWPSDKSFRLSLSGKFLARAISPSIIQILDTTNFNRLRLRTRGGNRVQIKGLAGGRDWLRIAYNNRSSYLIGWGTGELICHYQPSPFNPQSFSQCRDRGPGTWGFSVPSGANYSRLYLTFELKAMADELGQVWLFDHQDNLVCVFLLDQTLIAGWMPDGTYFGTTRLIATHTTPNAERHFAQALRDAVLRSNFRREITCT